MKLFTIPNIITLGNLSCGIFGIIHAFQGDLILASYFIFGAVILDFFDGFVARVTNSYSEIGKQLDSLADMVSSGLLPSFILYFLLKEQGLIQYIAFLPTLFSALRLAKFNIDERQSSSFRGIPTPANAITVASFPFILQENYTYLEFADSPYLFAVYAIVISLLLIADFPLFALKFKNFSWDSNQIRYIFLIVSLILLLVLQFTAVPLILILYIALSLLFGAENTSN